MVKYSNNDYENFRSMMECFVFRLRSAHLQSQHNGTFSKGMNSHIEGYNQYHNFWNGKGGHGHAKGNPLFQSQTQKWNLSNGNGQELRMAIKQSQAVKDYTDRANYVYWYVPSTYNGIDYSVNIAAKWDAGKKDIESFSLYYSWNKAAKQIDVFSFPLSSLGLYNNIITEELKLCLYFFTEMRDNVDLKVQNWKLKYEYKQRKIVIKNLLLNNYNLILTGAPGTGKTFLARKIASELIGCAEKDLENRDNFSFVQFHPSYDYTDFVEGLRPKRNITSTVTDFERKNGIFKEFCSKAAQEKEKAIQEKRNAAPYVFVIDEINRGEISKIFGELFFSIDPGYRKISKRIPVKTQYQNLVPKGDIFEKGFFVPENVYVIGTMNDIDRSVESMDFAFRRRFAFYEVKSKDVQENILAKCKYKDDAIRRMDNLNYAIENQEGFSSAYHIGASYFNKIDQYNGEWDKLWEGHLKGVLYEYLRGLPEAMKILNSWKESYSK